MVPAGMGADKKRTTRSAVCGRGGVGSRTGDVMKLRICKF